VTPSRRTFRSPSVEHGTDVNGGATAHTGPNFLPSSRPGTDSVFTPREQPSPRGDGQRIPQQMLTSPERRRPGAADNDRTARPPPIPSAYPSEHSRERPPALRPYDRERDWVREQQHEIERPHERERRWSLSEQRRFDYDRRPLDNADRRPPSYDRRPPPHLDDKRPSGYVDRRPLDDRRFPPDYDRRPLPEESRFGMAPSQDMPTQKPNGSDRRLSVSQAMKTGGPAPAPLASSSATPTSTTGTVAHALTPAPVDSTADRDTSVHSSPAPMSVDGQRNSNTRFVVPVDERSSTQVASGTQPQLVPRAEPTRPGVLLSSKPPENNTGIATPAQSVVVDARVSEPPHPDRFSISAAPVTTTTTAADDRSRPVSAAASHALREEPRLQPPPPPPQPRVSDPSLSLRAREPSRETQPSTFRSYFRPEFSRPSEDDRRLDMHPLPPPPPPPPAGDSFRRYDERGRWSPPPTTYADRRGGYRDYYDRDRDRDRDRERAYWDNNNNNNNTNKGYRSPPPPPRDRDRAPPSQPPPPPPHWDRGRAARYSEAPYAPDRRFSDDRDRSDRERAGWYAHAPPPHAPVPAPGPPASTFVGRPAPFDNTSSSFVQRGGPPGPRARSPGSPPPLKRARGEDGYAIPGGGPVPLPSSAAAAAAAAAVGATQQQVDYVEYAPQQAVPIPVPIPIGMRGPSRSPPRYAHAPHPHPHPHAHTHTHARPMHMEPYGPYGGYEREGGGVRGPPPGAAYAREGPR
jgi:hypothetical protein